MVFQKQYQQLCEVAASSKVPSTEDKRKYDLNPGASIMPSLTPPLQHAPLPVTGAKGKPHL
jgi:hypothetical protein